MKHQQKYRVFVTSQGFDKYQALEIAIRNSNAVNHETSENEIEIVFEVAQNVTLINGTTQIIEFDVSSSNFL